MKQVGSRMNHHDAINFCLGLGGGSRLPTREEYEALSRAMTVNGHYDRNRIPDMSDKWFWSASLHPNHDSACNFNGDNGNFYDGDLRDESSVRCVIGGFGVGI